MRGKRKEEGKERKKSNAEYPSQTEPSQTKQIKTNSNFRDNLMCTLTRQSVVFRSNHLQKPHYEIPYMYIQTGLPLNFHGQLCNF